MSGEYGTDLGSHSFSRSASLGSLFDPSDSAQHLRPTPEEVDQLLNALEHATNNNDSRLGIGRFTSAILDSELEVEPSPIREGNFGEEMLEHSLSGLHVDPISFIEFPSDPDLMFDPNDKFMQNSQKLDQFIIRCGNGFQKEGKQETVDEDNEEQVDYGYGDAAPTLADSGSFDDHPVETYPGKRRQQQRRGSMPTMHIGEYSSIYEAHNESSDQDPFEPTPIKDSPYRPQSALQGELETFEQQHQTQESQADDDDDAYSIQPEKRRRAQRRGSMPTMHVNYSINSEQNQSSMFEESSKTEPAPTPVMGMGVRMARRGSTGSFYVAHTSADAVKASSENPFGQTSQDDSGTTQDVPTCVFDTKAMMLRLHNMMQASQATQKALQTWDKKNGLPKSHSQTMVNSSRSRKQLQSGAILPKWDGTPLINGETELGKPKPRSLKALNKSARQTNSQLGRMQRRMSAPFC